ncbi:MAG: UvrD-helicase domain-containing protein [Prevotella sp.]|nr:UvrD-helicase domain-containing protein [Prevotella sp.]
MVVRDFNKEQLEVIEVQGGHHLVLAPPGCGKTAVLAERVVWAREHGVDFRDMACLTFTNRASRGMRERIWQRMPDIEDLDELFVGNVHRFCSQFLFQGGVVPDDASVIDTDTSMSIIADYLGEDELQVLAEAKHRQRYSMIINLQHLMYQCCQGYPSRLMVHRDALPPAALRELCTAFGLPYSRTASIDLYRHADHYRQEEVLLSSDARHLLEALYAAHQYERYKRRNDLLDFEDLLLRTYDTLAQDNAAEPHGTAAAHRRFSWIQVDEVQDLNPLQLAIIDLFATPQATVVYLGDAQQAIFSFMGAQTDTLTLLRQRCGAEGFHNFYQNYRSPQYLLNVFNEYGERQLGIARELLPTTQNLEPQRPGDLVLSDSETNIDEVNLVARMVKRLYEAYPNETTAVVVAFNSDADEVSAALGQLPHFKISGQDFFATPSMRLLLAHLGVLAMEHDFIAWSHIFAGLRVFATSSASRQFVHALIEQAVSPIDFLDYDGSTYVAEFVKTYEQQDLTIFDTETTGLSVFSDDVVQIAAIRVRGGKVIDELNLFLETTKPIPPMLGDVPNPLIEEYGRHEHLPLAVALQRFVAFARGSAILGHNATYDYQILEHNMRRHAPGLSMQREWPRYYDSLKLARLLLPRLQSYKLKALVEQLGLEGQNSHLANDDIMATKSLADHCYGLARQKVGAQLEFVSRHRRTAEKFRAAYRELFEHSRQRLYQQQTEPALPGELRHAYQYLLEQKKVEVLPKLTYLLRYIELDLLSEASGCSLSEQLARHIQDLSTIKEADLCGSASMQERVFVSTVHKAKGLEFDNVIVFDAVVGKYPSVYADTATRGEEEARKFYVAISRARRRLVVTYCRNAINRWGRMFSKSLTPYMDSIARFFS